MSGRLTTHVLDISTGKPARDVHIELWAFNASNQLEKRIESKTNQDGRVDSPLLEGETMKMGVYQLQFHIGDYFRVTEQKEWASFLNVVPIQFTISNDQEHYHVPLLIAPGGYSTYRGS
ncbi:hydroxyisourate hydrolase [Halalkalibacter alkalisediminis]|uniref:5-hydroxyisourate hydrolase n=1 Tax=Halalkalibacter alkalisediminis TaxID=935616 RepID=A0ABV6NFL1_9BACI|nr:hydroxyisourate hydrolase [Halalkalibacter alkalisediminis]